jgi:CheY-like chemotaxis protein
VGFSWIADLRQFNAPGLLLVNLAEDIRVVARAVDGEDGLQKLHHSSPDVVLLDVRMPKMGGIEFLQALREAPDAPPTILLTTFDDDTALLNGGDGWVIPEQPSKIFAEGREIHVPVLVGSNANEATVFISPNNPKTVVHIRNACWGTPANTPIRNLRLTPSRQMPRSRLGSCSFRMISLPTVPIQWRNL